MKGYQASHILQRYWWRRKQFVVVEGEPSSSTSVPSGVPQGSVLGMNCVACLGFSDGTVHDNEERTCFYGSPSSTPIIMFTYREIIIYNLSNSIESLYLSLNTSKGKYIIASQNHSLYSSIFRLHLNGSSGTMSC